MQGADDSAPLVITERPQESKDMAGEFGVEVRNRLIREQEFGLGNDRSRDGSSLPLPTGNPRYWLIRQGREAQLGEEFLGECLLGAGKSKKRAPGRVAGQKTAEDIGFHAGIRREGQMLKNTPDVSAKLSWRMFMAL
jgi:hypothetical protein